MFSLVVGVSVTGAYKLKGKLNFHFILKFKWFFHHNLVKTFCIFAKGNIGVLLSVQRDLSAYI